TQLAPPPPPPEGVTPGGGRAYAPAAPAPQAPLAPQGLAGAPAIQAPAVQAIPGGPPFGTMASPMDLAYNSGIPAPFPLPNAQRPPNVDKATMDNASELMRSQPDLVRKVALQLGLSLAAAAVLLSSGQLPQMAEGGRPLGGQPVVVGEQGPEVFVPDR